MTSGPINQGPTDYEYLIMDKDSLRLGDGLYPPFEGEVKGFPPGFVPAPIVVGDLSSSARGTGARANSNKVPLELLPLFVVATSLTPNIDPQRHVKRALWALGEFQAGGGTAELRGALTSTAIAAGLTLQQLFDEAALVLDHGRSKYTEWNWLKGMPWSVCIGCAARHLLHHMWINPDSRDDESGHLHAGHVACNLLFLMQYCDSYKEGDDRSPHFQPIAQPF